MITLLAAGKAEDGELSALEECFDTPPPRKYRPNFSPALPTRLKKYDVWEPNEARLKMLADYRVIFVGEKGAEAQGALKELVKSAGADYECLGADKGPEGLRQVLGKGMSKGKTLVPVAASGTVVASVGNEGWKALVEVARR